MFGRKPQRIEISVDAFREITARLLEQGIDFKAVDGAIDLTGVAIVQEQAQPEPETASGIPGHRPLSNVSVKIPRKRAQ